MIHRKKTFYVDPDQNNDPCQSTGIFPECRNKCRNKSIWHVRKRSSFSAENKSAHSARSLGEQLDVSQRQIERILARSKEGLLKRIGSNKSGSSIVLEIEENE